MGGGLYTKNILEYDSVANTWTTKTTMPGTLLTCRAGAHTFSINDTGYVGFGYDEDLSTMSETDMYDLWQYNKVANSWAPKHSFPSFSWYKIPGNPFVVNGKAYLAGGMDTGHASKQLWMYDPVADNWSQKHDLPGGVFSGAVFTLGSKAYLAFCNMDTGASSAVFEYDAIADVWTRKADVPAPRRLGPAAFVINGIAYIGIGSYYSGGALVYNDMYTYNQAGDSWTAVGSAPVTGSYVDLCVSMGNKAFVGGGKNISTGFYSQEWYEITSLSSSGIKPVTIERNINCFPNPATNTVELTGMPDCKSGCNYQVINSAGMVAAHGIWRNDKIDVKKLSVGRYLLMLDAEGERVITGFEKL